MYIERLNFADQLAKPSKNSLHVDVLSGQVFEVGAGELGLRGLSFNVPILNVLQI